MCGTAPELTHVTVVPGWTLMAAGEKQKSLM